MSGLEIAGLALGAIPVALELLKQYEEAATRVNLWREIQVEYIKCKRELELQAHLLRMNLRRLLLPLNGLDNTVIERLLADPRSDTWKDPSIEGQLEQRLQGMYRSYLGLMESFTQTMAQLKDTLAIDSDQVQSQIGGQKKSLKARMFDLDWWRYQMYKLKFTNGAKKRQTLLEKLDLCNTRLEKLLETSDEDSRLSAKRESAFVDERLCSFWLQATRMYPVLASRWDCACQASHMVNIPLEHSGQEATDLHLIWSNTQEDSLHSCQVRVSEKTNMAQEFEKLDIHQPPQRPSGPSKSATKKGKGPASSYHLRSPIPTIKISSTPTPAAVGFQIEEISSICSSLNTLGEGCIGYLLDKDQRHLYYVHRESTTNAFQDMSSTLKELIQNRTSEPPSRLQRVRMSLAIATSFIKLLDTPWMSQTVRGSDFVFSNDAGHSPHLVLEYALLAQGSSQSNKGGHLNLPFFGPMVVLGITLLELCFWSLLESQASPSLTEYETCNTEQGQRALDLATAITWRNKILDNTGPDYRDAVEWCFKGHPETSSTEWKRAMFQNVIQPLEKCNGYLSGQLLS